MLLHGYFRSSAAYRVRIALNLKGLSYEQSFVHLRRGEQRGDAYRMLNPQGLVPALDTGEGVLIQSMAIMEWLDETCPEPPLLPATPQERALVRGFAQIIAVDIHPLNNLRVLTFLSDDLGCDPDQMDKWRRKWIIDGLEACEALIARNSQEARFCFGDAPGLADVCLVPQIYSAERFGIDVTAWPRLSAVHQACEALPAFRDAHPQNQPDCDV